LLDIPPFAFSPHHEIFRTIKGVLEFPLDGEKFSLDLDTYAYGDKKEAD
jgi:hypothetical protein